MHRDECFNIRLAETDLGTQLHMRNDGLYSGGVVAYPGLFNGQATGNISCSPQPFFCGLKFQYSILRQIYPCVVPTSSGGKGGTCGLSQRNVASNRIQACLNGARSRTQP